MEGKKHANVMKVKTNYELSLLDSEQIKFLKKPPDYFVSIDFASSRNAFFIQSNQVASLKILSALNLTSSIHSLFLLSLRLHVFCLPSNCNSKLFDIDVPFSISFYRKWHSTI
jgi:hypothetical protein